MIAKQRSFLFQIFSSFFSGNFLKTPKICVLVTESFKTRTNHKMLNFCIYLSLYEFEEECEDLRTKYKDYLNICTKIKMAY